MGQFTKSGEVTEVKQIEIVEATRSKELEKNMRQDSVEIVDTKQNFKIDIVKEDYNKQIKLDVPQDSTILVRKIKISHENQYSILDTSSLISYDESEKNLFTLFLESFREEKNIKYYPIDDNPDKYYTLGVFKVGKFYVINCEKSDSSMNDIESITVEAMSISENADDIFLESAKELNDEVIAKYKELSFDEKIIFRQEYARWKKYKIMEQGVESMEEDGKLLAPNSITLDVMQQILAPPSKEAIIAAQEDKYNKLRDQMIYDEAIAFAIQRNRKDVFTDEIDYGLSMEENRIVEERVDNYLLKNPDLTKIITRNQYTELKLFLDEKALDSRLKYEFAKENFCNTFKVTPESFDRMEEARIRDKNELISTGKITTLGDLVTELEPKYYKLLEIAKEEDIKHTENGDIVYESELLKQQLAYDVAESEYMESIRDKYLKTDPDSVRLYDSYCAIMDPRLLTNRKLINVGKDQIDFKTGEVIKSGDVIRGSYQLDSENNLDKFLAKRHELKNKVTQPQIEEKVENKVEDTKPKYNPTNTDEIDIVEVVIDEKKVVKATPIENAKKELVETITLPTIKSTDITIEAIKKDTEIAPIIQNDLSIQANSAGMLEKIDEVIPQIQIENKSKEVIMSQTSATLVPKLDTIKLTNEEIQDFALMIINKECELTNDRQLIDIATHESMGVLHLISFNQLKKQVQVLISDKKSQVEVSSDKSVEEQIEASIISKKDDVTEEIKKETERTVDSVQNENQEKIETPIKTPQNGSKMPVVAQEVDIQVDTYVRSENIENEEENEYDAILETVTNCDPKDFDEDFTHRHNVNNDEFDKLFPLEVKEPDYSIIKDKEIKSTYERFNRYKLSGTYSRELYLKNSGFFVTVNRLKSTNIINNIVRIVGGKVDIESRDELIKRSLFDAVFQTLTFPRFEYVPSKEEFYSNLHESDVTLLFAMIALVNVPVDSDGKIIVDNINYVLCPECRKHTDLIKPIKIDLKAEFSDLYAQGFNPTEYKNALDAHPATLQMAYRSSKVGKMYKCTINEEPLEIQVFYSRPTVQKSLYVEQMKAQVAWDSYFQNITNPENETIYQEYQMENIKRVAEYMKDKDISIFKQRFIKLNTYRHDLIGVEINALDKAQQGELKKITDEIDILDTIDEAINEILSTLDIIFEYCKYIDKIVCTFKENDEVISSDILDHSNLYELIKVMTNVTPGEFITDTFPKLIAQLDEYKPINQEIRISKESLKGSFDINTINIIDSITNKPLVTAEEELNYFMQQEQMTEEFARALVIERTDARKRMKEGCCRTDDHTEYFIIPYFALLFFSLMKR